MYEAEHEKVSGFHPETVQRMREVFKKHICCMCRGPAERLCGGEFFCHEHYPKAHTSRRVPRVYRCHVAVEA